MDLRDFFQRLFNEQQWREQRASAMGIPLHSSFRDSGSGMMMPEAQGWGGNYSDHLPLPFDQRIHSALPGLFDMFNKQQEYQDKFRKDWNGVPSNILERLMINMPKQGWRDSTDSLMQQPL